MTSQRRPRPRGCRVLLADDHALIRDCVRAILEDEGHEVVGEANDGVEASRLAGLLDPEIVILDVTLPVLDGLGAGRQILKVSPRTLLIALGTDGDRAFVTAASEAGFRGYVVKQDASHHLGRAVQAVRRGARYFDTAPFDPPRARWDLDPT